MELAEGGAVAWVVQKGECGLVVDPAEAGVFRREGEVGGLRDVDGKSVFGDGE